MSESAVGSSDLSLRPINTIESSASLGSLPPVTKLRTSLTLNDDTLLRGTFPSTLLECFGRRLRSTITSGSEDAGVAEEEYLAKSFAVQTLDVFLSHSWTAPWLQKYFALLLHFNFGAAMSAYLICLLIPCGLRFLFSWTNSQISPLFIHLFACTMFFITLLGFTGFHKTSVFFDKVCIHQSNEKLKAKGIKSIGAFLARTENMLIAWDKTYFQRLWCAYEICTFTYSQPDGRIHVLPVRLSEFMVAMIVFSFTITTVSKTSQIYWGCTCLAESLSTSIVLMLGNVTFIPSVRRYMRDVECLGNQISTFSVRDTSCFCCANQHRHPDTGKRLPCDRQLVYASITHWHGSSDQTSALDTFDSHVRTFLLKKAHPGRLGVSYGFLVALGICSNGTFLVTILMTDHVVTEMALQLGCAVYSACILIPLRISVLCLLAKFFAEQRTSNLVDALLNLLIVAVAEFIHFSGRVFRVYLERPSHEYRFQLLLVVMMLCAVPLRFAFSRSQDGPTHRDASVEFTKGPSRRSSDWSEPRPMTSLQMTQMSLAKF